MYIPKSGAERGGVRQRRLPVRFRGTSPRSLPVAEGAADPEGGLACCILSKRSQDAPGSSRKSLQ